MSAKKKPLLSAFQNLDRKEPVKPALQPQTEVTAEHVQKTQAAPRKAVVAKTRTGKKGITFFIDQEAHRQLKLLSVEQDVSIEALMRDALNDLFQKNQKSRIA